ncbi:MAG: hypothetical protein CVV61_07925 [Tenericutes bacterium HGW-Tenericutes-6]|jgi:transposase-like protein|nr:MAG: hypothetical protein CVV61_07925 [Tenericutes bacterium HGW-Tenericutes-6]
MRERKTRKHPQYTIEEKNKIVKAYLSQEMRMIEVTKFYDVNKGVFQRWIKQFRQFGTAVDGRGKANKSKAPHKGRPRKIDLESMTKEELIEYIKVGEEIKKTVAYLSKQRKNITS